ncbi:hypothetical protein ACOME3_004748 [Neoechinorhynchus agilis]
MSVRNGQRRGRLIVFEGLDRSGKTTQIRMCEDWLDTRCRLIRFPYRENSTGRFISDILSKQVPNPNNPRLMHLLFSANRWEEKARIDEWLSKGFIVLVDRYHYSGFAYTRAQDSSISAEWLKAPENGLPEPDCVIMLDGDPHYLASSRNDYGNEIYEEIEFQSKVRAAYKAMMNKNDERWHIINVSGQTPTDIHNAVKEIITDLL